MEVLPPRAKAGLGQSTCKFPAQKRAVDLANRKKKLRAHRYADSRYYIHATARKKTLLTGHYGNFEIMGYVLGLFGFNTYSIARPLDNKFINNYLYEIRQRVGQKIIDKKGAAEIMSDLLASGSTLCFIVDQDAGKKGIFVDFFGRKASTYKSIALLAITNNIPIGIAYSRRLDNRFFFEIAINRLIFPEEWAQKDDPIKWVTEEYTKAIEDFIREDPTQYWWLHRRWKHQPKEKRGKTPAEPSETPAANNVNTNSA